MGFPTVLGSISCLFILVVVESLAVSLIFGREVVRAHSVERKLQAPTCRHLAWAALACGLPPDTCPGCCGLDGAFLVIELLLQWGCVFVGTAEDSFDPSRWSFVFWLMHPSAMFFGPYCQLDSGLCSLRLCVQPWCGLGRPALPSTALPVLTGVLRPSGWSRLPLSLLVSHFWGRVDVALLLTRAFGHYPFFWPVEWDLRHYRFL